MSEDKDVIKKILEKSKTEIKKMSIVYDGTQYSVRIPRDFVETIKEIMGDLEKMKFEFTLKIPAPKSKEKAELTGELIDGQT